MTQAEGIGGLSETTLVGESSIWERPDKVSYLRNKLGAEVFNGVFTLPDDSKKIDELVSGASDEGGGAGYRMWITSQQAQEIIALANSF